tara:strand:+ start:1869 stop:2114 length:246 start_codon:yes stop_codon:yes gene_type:complete
MTEERKNDDLIIYKLDEIKTDVGDLREQLHSHIEKTEHTIHGNGNPGLKTTVAEISAKLKIMSGVVAAFALAIFNDYFFRQ